MIFGIENMMPIWKMERRSPLKGIKDGREGICNVGTGFPGELVHLEIGSPVICLDLMPGSTGI